MDTFSIIKDGTSFDRKRFGDDIALFSAPSKKIKREVPSPKTENIRKEFQIHTEGSEVPAPINSWDSLGAVYSIPILSTVKSLYTNMTAIQMQAIPCILQKRDVIGIAPTGSGKTLSFLLPMISSLGNTSHLRGVILAPTKELARQIFKETVLLSQETSLQVHSLRKKSPAISELEQSVDIIISTPLLFLHKLGEHSVQTIEFFVLDEADQLFDMGFLDQIDTIFKQCECESKLLFCATLFPSIEILAKSILISPIKIQVGMKNTTAATLEHELIFCSNEQGKLIALKQLQQTGKFKPPVLIFVQSKTRAKELFKELRQISGVGLLHSDLNNAEREIIVKNFREGRIWVMICTDLLSRGIDFAGINLVINFDFPQSATSYIHRVGRAGRAGRNATALTFYTFEDAPYVKIIVNVLKRSGETLPEWMTQLKGPTKQKKKALETKPVKRESIGRKIKLSRSLRRFMKKKQQNS